MGRRSKAETTVRMRTPKGDIVEVPLDFIEPYGQEVLRRDKLGTVRRRRCTFLPGVNPQWDAHAERSQRGD